MKTILSGIGLCAILFACSFAQLPPLLDQDIFFGNPEISGTQISPDGKFITFIKPFKNVRNIWIVECAQKFDQARPLTADSLHPVTGYFWSQDSRYVLYAQDKAGKETYRIYAVDPLVPGSPVPPAKDLTPVEHVRAVIFSTPRSTPNDIIIGMNDRSPSQQDIYRLNLTTGEKTLLGNNTEHITGWITDLKGDLRLGTRKTNDGGTEILKIDGGKLSVIYSVNADEFANPLRFTPDGNSFYLATNKGPALDLTELELFDMKTGTTRYVEKDPENQVDFEGALFSGVTNEMEATYYSGDSLIVYPRQKQFALDYGRLRQVFPKGELRIMSATLDEKTWLVEVARDVDPGSVYSFDRKTGKAEFLYAERPDLPSDKLCAMKPIRFKARDGMIIPGYLTLPNALQAAMLPTVLFIHGGPWGRDVGGYNPVVQLLASRGYAVLQPNFRGSAGYGKKFLNAGNKQWGTGSMQHDITDAVEYITKQGIADPKKVGIAGISYGGYAVLAGLAFTPDLYAAGFDIAGPSNIITLINSISPYWTSMRKTFMTRVGNQDDSVELKMLEAQSPLYSAKNIKAPLFIVQGTNDTRATKAESDQIVVTLRDLGRKVEYMVAPDEGHGFKGVDNRTAMFTAMEKFFAKYLNGRCWQNVRPSIKARLDTMMVDIKTVSLPKPADSAR